MELTAKQQIDRFRLKVIESGLKLELKGMRHSTNSVFIAAKQITGEKSRKKCLEAIEKMLLCYCP